MDKGEAQKHGPSTRKGRNETNPRTISTRELVGSEEWRLESTPSPARSGVEAGRTGNKKGRRAAHGVDSEEATLLNCTSEETTTVVR
jgi:hypothetical protein